MIKSTVNSTESKFDMFYYKFNKFYYAVMPWFIAITAFLAMLMVWKGVE